MKKIFTLLSLMLFFVVLGANAQDRKTWDFTKGVGDESRALLDGATDKWDRTGDPSTAWTSKYCPDGEIMVGDKVIKEFSGLQFSDFEPTKGLNALMLKTNGIRFSKTAKMTLPALKAGQKIVVRAQSANATAKDRGFAFTNADIEEGPENGICLGRDAEGAPEGGVTVFKLSVVADGVVAFSTGMTGTPAAGVEILSIVVDEGDPNIKIWDFSSWSEATKAQVCGAQDWTKKESASKDYITGDEIRWIDAVNIDANENLTAGGEAIKEMMGLRHTGLGQYGLAMAFDYQTTTDGNNWGPYNKPSYLWVMTTASTITVPNVKAGSTFKVASESHKPGDPRGFTVSVNGANVTSASGESKSADYTVFEYTIPAGDEEYVNVVLTATKGCHLYSIEAEVKDEAIVDKNPKLNKPEFTIKDGARVNPLIDSFTMTFPKAQNIADAFNVSVKIDGYYAAATEDANGDGLIDYNDAVIVDGFEEVEGNVAEGVVAESILALEENTPYVLCITKVAVGTPYETLTQEAAEGEALYSVNFTTTGKGIQEVREWAFSTDADIAASMATSVDDEENIWASQSNSRYSVKNPIAKASELMLNSTKKLSITEGLFFTMSNANDILFGTPSNNSYNRMQLGGGAPHIIVPSCNAGDEVTITLQYSSSSSPAITITNGVNKADDSNVISIPKSKSEVVVKVTENGDLELACKNAAIWAMKVIPAHMLEGEVKVTVVAKADDMVLGTLKGETVVKKNTPVTGYYSYYMKGSDDQLYTAGAKGSPFEYTFAPMEDGELVLAYKKKNIDGLVKVVYCSEGENIENATPCTEGNFAIRCSNGAAAMAETDLTLCTLPAGTYRIKAMPYDMTKNGGVTNLNFTIGEEKRTIVSNGDNMSEPDPCDPIVVTADTPVVWNAGGDAGHGLDAIIIYEYDETLGINNAAVVAPVAKVVKTTENGQIVIIKGAKKYTVAGAQLK